MRFTILAQSRSNAARVGRADTAHGSFDTPAFLPVGSRGSVKGITPDQLKATGAQIILANAYHLMLRPGAEVVERLGGLHRFMGWSGPILTDSGGYQAHSMSDINRIDDDGITFRSIVDGALVHLSPRRAIEVQNALGADIIMALDDCPPAGEPAGDRQRWLTANERTVRWLEQGRPAHQRPDDQALFGIVQGGTDLELRRASVEAVCNIDRRRGGGGAAGADPQGRRIHGAAVARRPAAVPDGGRLRARPGGRGAGGGGPVRLRAADTEWPKRDGVHPSRAVAATQCPVPGRRGGP